MSFSIAIQSSAFPPPTCPATNFPGLTATTCPVQSFVSHITVSPTLSAAASATEPQSTFVVINADEDEVDAKIEMVKQPSPIHIMGFILVRGSDGRGHWVSGLLAIPEQGDDRAAPFFASSPSSMHRPDKLPDIKPRYELRDICAVNFYFKYDHGLFAARLREFGLYVAGPEDKLFVPTECLPSPRRRSVGAV